jgi:DNA-binding response OmpR family regulator
VDDDVGARTATARLLEAEGFGVITAATGDEAIAAVGDNRADLVLLDVSMPRQLGPEVRQRLRRLAPRLPVVFITGHLFASDADDVVLVKPVSAELLVAKISKLLDASR